MLKAGLPNHSHLKGCVSTSKVLLCQLFVLINLGMLVTGTNLASVSFLSFSDLLFMHWTAEAATLSPALSQYGHLVQWWMTVELKVLSHLTFSYCAFLYFFLSIFCTSLISFHIITIYLNGYLSSVHTSLKFLPFLNTTMYIFGTTPFHLTQNDVIFPIIFCIIHVCKSDPHFKCLP